MKPIPIQRGTSPLVVLSLGQLLDLDLPPKEDLITPWLRQGESALLYAPTGVGKSMLALSIALAVAGGGELLGWKVATPRRVLFVDGEMALEDIRDRARDLAQTVDGLDMEAARENFSILARQHQGANVRFPDLAEEEGRTTLVNQIRAARASLVILDNLSTLATVADENEASSFNDTTRFLLTLKQSGMATILVHHSGKAGTDYRGSSKLATTFEVIMGLRKLEGMAGARKAGFELVYDKYRQRPDALIQDRKVWLSDEDGTYRWVSEASEGGRVNQVLEAVRSGRFSSQKEIAEALGVDPAAVTRSKATAIRLGRISEAEWKEYLEQGGPPDF